MAAPSTIVSATLEQSILETLAKAIVARNAYVAANPAADLQGFAISQTINLATNRVTFQVTLPVTVSNDADGGQSIDVPEVMPAV